MQKNNYLSTLAWVVWIIAAAFYAYEFFIRVSPSVMIPELMSALKVNAGTLGALSASYYYAYAIMQIPVGIILDRFGIHRLLALAALLVGLASFIFAHTDNLMIANFSRVLMGIGSAFSFVGCLKLSSNWFSLTRFATIVGLTNTVGILGAISAQAPLATAVLHYGRCTTMSAVGLTGLLLAFLLFSLVKDSPDVTCIIKRKEKSDARILGMGLLAILKNKQTWLVAILGGLMVAPVSGFTELWSIPFLMKAHHIGRPFAGALASIMFIGIAVGGPAHGAFATMLGKRKPILLVGAFGALLCLIAIIYLPLSNFIILVSLLFLFGFLTSSMLLCFTINAKSNPKWATGASIGFTNMLVMMGGTIFQPLIGYLLDGLHQTAAKAHNAAAFSTADYRIALSLLPACLVVALVVTLFIKDEDSREIEII